MDSLASEPKTKPKPCIDSRFPLRQDRENGDTAMECSAHMFFSAAATLVLLYALPGALLAVVAVRRLRYSFKHDPSDTPKADERMVIALSLASWPAVAWLMFSSESEEALNRLPLHPAAGSGKRG